MTTPDLELAMAMAEFLAKNTPVVCDPVLSEKQAKELAKKRIEKYRQDADYERAERNAENLRHDNEGFYHIGGSR